MSKCSRCSAPFTPNHPLTIVCDSCMEKDPNLTVNEKAAMNLWDHLDDFLVVYNKMKEDDWQWYKNTDCKYVDLRIDMRDGGCIIRNGSGKRISPGQLAWQYSAETPEGIDEISKKKVILKTHKSKSIWQSK